MQRVQLLQPSTSPTKSSSLQCIIEISAPQLRVFSPLALIRMDRFQWRGETGDEEFTQGQNAVNYHDQLVSTCVGWPNAEKLASTCVRV